LESCTVTLGTGQRYLLVMVPPDATAGQTFTISSETSFPTALAAGDAHASVTIQDPHPDEGVEFALGGTLTLQSVSAERVTARVHATFEVGDFSVAID